MEEKIINNIRYSSEDIVTFEKLLESGMPTSVIVETILEEGLPTTATMFLTYKKQKEKEKIKNILSNLIKGNSPF